MNLEHPTGKGWRSTRMADRSKLVRKHQKDALDNGEEVVSTLLIGPCAGMAQPFDKCEKAATSA